MRKWISWFVLGLTIAVLLLESFFGITGAIDVARQFAELEAQGASGHEYWGVGIEILALSSLLLSAVGGILSLVSWKLAQGRWFKLLSAVLGPMFLLPIFVAALIVGA